MFAIVTDSCSSLPVREIEGMGVAVCPLTVNFGTESFSDGFELSSEQFYVKMAEYAPQGLPKTACPAPGVFTKAYEEALAAGAEGVICITLAAGVSGAYNAAHVGADAVEAGKVAVINSKDTTVIETVLIETAVRLRDEGVSFAEAIERLQAIVDASRSYYAFDTIENIVKGRPTSDLESMDAAALKVKPLIYLDDDEGGIVACGKERTLKGLLASEFAFIKGFVEEHPEHSYEVRFAHGNAADRAQQLKEMCEAEGIATSDAGFGWVGSVIGTYCGEKSVVAGIYPADLL